LGLVSPKETPAEIINLLNREISRGLVDPNVRQRFSELGGYILQATPAEFGRPIVNETEKWARVVKFSGAQVE
jgi:tripartite-type tricarboxylate transporter receptor subunit TctC